MSMKESQPILKTSQTTLQIDPQTADEEMVTLCRK